MTRRRRKPLDRVAVHETGHVFMLHTHLADLHYGLKIVTIEPNHPSIPGNVLLSGSQFVNRGAHLCNRDGQWNRPLPLDKILMGLLAGTVAEFLVLGLDPITGGPGPDGDTLQTAHVLLNVADMPEAAAADKFCDVWYQTDRVLVPNQDWLRLFTRRLMRAQTIEGTDLHSALREVDAEVPPISPIAYGSPTHLPEYSIRKAVEMVAGNGWNFPDTVHKIGDDGA